MSVKTIYRQGRTEIDGRAFVDFAVRHSISYADQDASHQVRLPLEAGRHVLGVRVRTLEAFTGGSPTVKIGDLQDDDGYIQTTDVDVTALNSAGDSRQMGHDVTGTHTLNAYARGGRYYAAPNQIVVTMSASLTAGRIALEVIFDGYEDGTRDMIANQ